MMFKLRTIDKDIELKESWLMPRFIDDLVMFRGGGGAGGERILFLIRLNHVYYIFHAIKLKNCPMNLFYLEKRINLL